MLARLTGAGLGDVQRWGLQFSRLIISFAQDSTPFRYLLIHTQLYKRRPGIHLHILLCVAGISDDQSCMILVTTLVHGFKKYTHTHTHTHTLMYTMYTIPKNRC